MKNELKRYILNNFDTVEIKMIGEDGIKHLSLFDLSNYLNGNIRAIEDGGYVIEEEDDYYIHIK